MELLNFVGTHLHISQGSQAPFFKVFDSFLL